MIKSALLSVAPARNSLRRLFPPSGDRVPVLTAAVPDESMRGAAVRGWIIIVLFFGGLLGWAAFAPLNGAVVANGFVKVEGNRKTIQHLEGGIIKELRVSEGARVVANDVVLALDDTQAQAEVEIYAKQYLVLRCTEERLRAEAANAPALRYPSEFADRQSEPDLNKIWRAQVAQFKARRVALNGQRRIIDEKIAQLKAQIVGSEAQMRGLAAQWDSLRRERDSLLPLLEKGLIAKPRVLQLERSASGLEGQIGETGGTVARARQAIAEQVQQAAQLDHERASEIARELKDTQTQLVEINPKLMQARVVLERTVVRSPYNGRVVSLNVFSIGGVIGRGEKLMDVVPDREAMIIEAQIGVDEITDVHPDMPVEVHLTAYKQRSVPIVKGEVVQVSADRLSDTKTGSAYYVAQIRLLEGELPKVPHVRLYPGMPATIIIPTVERTALSYLMNPLSASFTRAFRQR